MKRILVYVVLILNLFSCGDDDNLVNITSVPPRRLSEVALENNATIREYLATHFYNEEDFISPSDDFDFRIIIDTIAGENANRVPLLQQVDSIILNVSDASLGLEFGETNVPHTLYYLEAQRGAGNPVGVADSTFVTFEGFLLDGTIFESQLGGGSWLDLEGSASVNNQGIVTGLQEGMQNFRSGSGVTEFSDGTFEVNDVGVGLVIMPSGIGFFNSIDVGPPFSPVVFNLNILFTTPADHDNDGLISVFENLDGDSNFLNDDTDADGLPNYLDFDDDGDGTLTEDEVLFEGESEIMLDENGQPVLPDSDNDNIPDYLDPDSN